MAARYILETGDNLTLVLGWGVTVLALAYAFRGKGQ